MEIIKKIFIPQIFQVGHDKISQKQYETSYVYFFVENVNRMMFIRADFKVHLYTFDKMQSLKQKIEHGVKR